MSSHILHQDIILHFSKLRYYFQYSTYQNLNAVRPYNAVYYTAHYFAYYAYEMTYFAYSSHILHNFVHNQVYLHIIYIVSHILYIFRLFCIFFTYPVYPKSAYSAYFARGTLMTSRSISQAFHLLLRSSLLVRSSTIQVVFCLDDGLISSRQCSRSL